MSKELVTRGPLKGLEMSVPWMLTSGQPDPRFDRTGLPGRATVGGIQLYVVGENRMALRLDLDVHDAGELYTALEAHMENVAAPPAPDFRESNLKAFQEEIDKPLFKSGMIAGPGRALSEQERAVLAVIEAWTNNGPHANVNHGQREDNVRKAFPGLAAALDKLAHLLF